MAADIAFFYIILRAFIFLIDIILFFDGYPPIFNPFFLQASDLVRHALLPLVLELADRDAVDRFDGHLVLLLRLLVALLVFQERLFSLERH